MELPVSSDCGACPQLFCKDGAFGACSSSHDHAATQQPAKKQTRQWAAWTRQEEESFFTALRQVGKNFEKITYRVQSKNKDQVRHYYYRLVRRMNKLLGPELCLDAKNDKDTNAAMLRWWSLLEKHSCKASKLHLKPRRFKIFLDTLEHQLLKDRRKNIRKRHAQGDVCSMTSTAAVIGHGKAVVNDTQAVKVVLLDSQNIQRFGSGKGSSLKRNANMGTNRSNCKGDSIPLKAVRQRRKPGNITSTAAYKRWEKAAIAGVSLVADAAEHLERTALEEVPEHDKGAFQEVIGGDKDLEPVQKVVTSSATPLRNLFSENCAQTSSKLKLQLFPLDEITRRALELDDHNPYLELTLSTRKKISSVLEHLTRKWGKSSIACGELLLLPYWIEKENLSNCQRWTQDSVLSAADVYKQIGSPSLFRLRYCWLSSDVHEPMTVQAPVAFPSILKEQLTKMTGTDLQLADLVPGPTLPEHVPGDPFGVHRNQVVSSGNVSESATTSANMHDDIIGINADPNMNIGFPCDNVPAISSQRKTRNVAIRKEAEEKDEMRFQTRNILTPGEWADSLTNISFGDLLYEASDDVDDDCVGPSNAGYQSQVPFSCDSFDAAIAALIYKNQDKAGFHPTLESHAPSIWDAEETCDAFSFRKSSVSPEKISGASTNDPSEACREFAKQSLVASDFVIEESSEMKAPPVDKAHGDPMDEFQPDPNTIEDSTKDSTGLSDLYWSESLAPLDLDRPSCKYHNEDLILSDSMSGLNRLIASSLDAFQNLSFFGLDKKDSASVVETREGISFSDYKNGSQVEISKV